MNTQLEVATTNMSTKSALPVCEWVYFATTAKECMYS